MKSLLRLFLVAGAMLTGLAAKAQTLNAGDIVVLGLAADTGAAGAVDEFSWVPLVNLSAGTKIYFTDAGWNSASNEFMGAGDTGEILFRYVVPAGGILAGTVQTVTEGGTPDNYTLVMGTKCGNDSLLSIPNAGDQIFVFQSNLAENASFPGTATGDPNTGFKPIFGVTNSTTNWASMTANTTTMKSGSDADNQTNLMAGLTNGVTAIAVGNNTGPSDEADNVRYVGTNSGSRTTLLAAITTYANWNRHDGAGNQSDFTSENTGWTSFNATYAVSGSDNIPPTVSSIVVSGSPAGNATSVGFTVTFGESVSNVSTDDFQLTTTGSATGTISSVSSSSGTSMTVNVGSISGVGSLRLDFKSNTNVVDGMGNGGGTNGFAPAFTSGSVHTVDTAKPNVTISSSAPNPTNSSLIPITVTFSEAVTGFSLIDVSVVNGSLSGLSGSGTSYTFNVTPSTDGTITLNIPANIAQDAATNGNNAATQFSITSDRTQPNVVISSSASNPTNLSSIPITITFNESVQNFVVGDIVVSGGTLSGFSGSGANYTVNLIPSGTGTKTLNIASAVANDLAGNSNTVASQFSIVSDTAQPTVSITSAQSNPTNATQINLNITFSESVTGFASNDFSISGGSFVSLSGSGASYAAVVAPTGGTLTVNIGANAAFDTAGNGNVAATQFSIFSDLVAPTVSISSTAPDPTNQASIPITVTFSESVSNFIASDISVANGSISGFSGSGTTYTASLTLVSGTTASVSVGAGVAGDAAGNGNTASATFTRVSDQSAPTLAITSSVSNPTNATSFTVNFTFSEAVSGFALGDIVGTNAVISGLTGSGASYSATVTPSANGNVSVSVGAGAASDAAGNASLAATTFNVVSDTAAPVIGISTTASNPTNANTVPLTFTFSESVTNFTESDIFVTNGAISGFAGSGASYTATLTPSAEGAVNVFILQGNVTDAAGNANALTTFSIVSDKTRPTVSITSSATSPTSTSPIPLTITFSEPVVNFVQSDITVTGGTLSGFSGSGASYSVNLTPSGTGTKTVNVAANVASDAAGNLNFAATQFSIAYLTPCSLTTTWNGLFWTNGDPIPTQPAVIAANLDITYDLAACSLIVGNNAVVNVLPGVNVTITGAVNVQPGSSMTFEMGANLLQNPQGTGNSNVGNIVMKRAVSLWRLDYVYWGAPVSSQNLFGFSPLTLTNRFYTYSEPSNTFVTVFPSNDTATYTFEAGKGYIVRAPNTFPTVGVDPSPATFNGVFTGTPNNGTISQPVSVSSPANGYNLLANPYPSTLDADAFLTANPGTIYFWTHSNQTAANGANYATYNLLGGIAAAAGGEQPNGFIQIGQGFLMKNNAAGTVTFTNAMRSNNTDGQFFRSAVERHRLWIDLTQDGAPLSQTLVGYMTGATSDADVAIDGPYLCAGSSLTSRIGETTYGIQGRALPFDEQDVVPLQFHAVAAGQFTITLSQMDGLFEDGQPVFLRDYLTGVSHDLKAAPYTFVSDAGSFADRFELRYVDAVLHVGLPVDKGPSVVVYKAGDVLRVAANGALVEAVSVFDLRGRVLYRNEGFATEEAVLSGLQPQQQALIVKVRLADGTEITRKALY